MEYLMHIGLTVKGANFFKMPTIISSLGGTKMRAHIDKLSNISGIHFFYIFFVFVVLIFFYELIHRVLENYHRVREIINVFT